MGPLGLVLVALLVVVISRLWNALVLQPRVTTKVLREQGINGPDYKFFVGATDDIKSMKAAADMVPLDLNCHDFIPRVLPHFRKWMSVYGKTFMYWFGPRPMVCITDPELAKQILFNKADVFEHMPPNPNVRALFGKGLPMTKGAEWARHRKVLQPAFTMDKLKTMTKTMAECCLKMIERWEREVLRDEDHEAVIEMSSSMAELTSDVISCTAFGSNYKEGIEVFMAQKEIILLAVATSNTVLFPGYKYLPTRRNLYQWSLERKIRGLLMQIINQRIASKEDGYGNDLLGLMLESCMPENGESKEDRRMSLDEIIGECKSFFFAGQDTTSHLLTWTMFLLSTNQDWQEKLREEVIRECGKEIPNGDMLNKLKLVTMVLYETLRLYSPVVVTTQRITAANVELGSMKLPKGTGLVLPLAMIHRDKEIWGADVNEFNPLRFQNGISKAANHPNAFVAFSVGPRHCIGQDFAMMEAKTVLAMILQRFSFSLEPKYIHAPKDVLTLQPKYGLPIVLEKMDASA